MEHHDLTDDLDRRLRAVRPAEAIVDPLAFDGALFERVRQGPVAARRSVPRSVALPVAAGAIAVATAAVMLGGGPDNVGGPASAAAITQQTLRWLDPPAHSILHVRSVETDGGAQTTTREFWQSVDDPNVERELVSGAETYETSGDAIYDPATNTIYDPPGSSIAVGDLPAPSPTAPAAKIGSVGKDRVEVHGTGSLPAGDPIVDKVRILLQQGQMTIAAGGMRDGSDSWAISLKPGGGRTVWTLWVSASDGKPLELSDPDPGPAAGGAPQVITWPVYDVQADDAATDQLLTLTGAHPSAQVVSDPAQVDAAMQRLMPPKP